STDPSRSCQQLASHPTRSFRLQLFYTTPAAPAHPAILASWSRFVDESSYTLSAIDDILARVRALVA
ncbi:MAG TPA: hypothetical protein PKG98_12635, partial [Myxococcota bacterium]|nr:hypothetical protein [Myxococcota bacterium]